MDQCQLCEISVCANIVHIMNLTYLNTILEGYLFKFRQFYRRTCTIYTYLTNEVYPLNKYMNIYKNQIEPKLKMQ